MLAAHEHDERGRVDMRTKPSSIVFRYYSHSLLDDLRSQSPVGQAERAQPLRYTVERLAGGCILIGFGEKRNTNTPGPR
jgi:hypothetical protein